MGIVMRDGVAVACDDGMHEWCATTACECGCHEQPQAGRGRPHPGFGGNTPPLPSSARSGDPVTSIFDGRGSGNTPKKSYGPRSRGP